MIRPIKLALSRATAPSSLKVCDCTYLAMALVKQAEARHEHKLDAGTTSMLYALAGDAMYMAAGASKSVAAAQQHRREGDGYYALAQRVSPVLLKELA